MGINTDTGQSLRVAMALKQFKDEKLTYISSANILYMSFSMIYMLLQHIGMKVIVLYSLFVIHSIVV